MLADLKVGRPSESGGHWYSQDGSCVYEIRSKSNGNLRPVTLRDARKLGLVPGFSTIAAMEHKPQLQKWLIEQAVLAVLTLPRIPGETDEDFKNRAYWDARAQADTAAARGTHLHGALQGWYENQPMAAEDAPYVLPVVEWLDRRFPNTKWLPEQSFAHPAGYGGKCDLHSPEAVIDFKFKAFSDPDKVRGYDNHEDQLHAYEYGFGLKNVQKINLFISSTEPGMIVPVIWPDNPSSLEAFLCLLRLWQLRKGYDSSFVREAA